MKEQCRAQTKLPIDGFVRLTQLIGPNGVLPVGRTTLWKLVRTGRFPKPIRLAGQRISVWRVDDVRDALARLSEKCGVIAAPGRPSVSAKPPRPVR